MRRRAHARSTVRIYNGIDPDLYREAPTGEHPSHSDATDGPIVGFAGRLIDGKGTEHLIDTLGLMGAENSLELLIAGDGPERGSLEERASRLGLGSRVRFLGVVEDMVAFWQGCDVAAVPSQAQESFSMVTLEAMSCGKAVVASRTGAIPELVVDGQTGTLVAPGDAGALATALARYAQQPDLRHSHGGAARARALERFHIEDCARAYIELFDRLARQPSRPDRRPALAS
jgi:glycosyltransferase involved in cell wall biosynthesis